MADPDAPELTKKQRAVELLKESIRNVMRSAFQMKRAMDQEDLSQALKFAAEMLGELRTSLLSPLNYNELYMKARDELMYLDMFFRDLVESGKEDVVALYQRVQSCGNVLPRLYLLFCVGGIYIKSKKGVCKDILKDMVEMGKGVQHPTRGLFLRDYLSAVSKDKLPDQGSEYEGPDSGNTSDAIEFVLQNFCEMNRLWVRMQSQGKVKKKKKREKERQQLKILVGTNLVRLSNLEGVTLKIYQNDVLPKIMEEVVNCKDPIAQFYLMDCIIQVFPDEFHLGTLETFLETCTTLVDGVDVKNILIRLMDRIAGYVGGGSVQIPEDAFSLFNKYVAQVLQSQQAMEVNDILELQIALLNFSNSCYPNKLDYVDHILGFSAKVLGRLVGAGSKVPPESEDLVKQLLTTPLETLALAVLQLKNFAPLMATLRFIPRKAVAVQMLRAVVDVDGSRVDSVDMCEQLLTFISPLVVDEEDTPSALKEVEERSDQMDDEDEVDEFTVEQQLVSRLVALFENDDTDVLFNVYNLARKAFGKGGMRRIKFTLVPLTFGYFRLARRIRAREQAVKAHKKAAQKAAAAAAAAAPAKPVPVLDEKGEPLLDDEGNPKMQEVDTPPPAPAAPVGEAPPAPATGSKKIYQHVHGLITALAGVDEYQTLALTMFLEASRSAGECGFEAIAYEFITRAFALYEDTADSKAQVRALVEMIGTLQSSTAFGEENYDTLITNTTKYAAKLLKKNDQCRMVAQCAHLFWTGRPAQGGEPRHNDDNRALECLKRALKIADGIMDPVANVELFIDILNEYLYYYSQECPKIEVKYVKGLLNLIREHMAGLGSEGAGDAKQRFENTIRYIKKKSKENDSSAKRYQAIMSK
jgi:vacuolar protein sorting-associated protein 35